MLDSKVYFTYLLHGSHLRLAGWSNYESTRCTMSKVLDRTAPPSDQPGNKSLNGRHDSLDELFSRKISL